MEQIATPYTTKPHIAWYWRSLLGLWLSVSMLGAGLLMVADLIRLVILPNLPRLDLVPNWMWTLGTCLKADLWEQAFYLLLHGLFWGSLVFLPKRSN